MAERQVTDEQALDSIAAAVGDIESTPEYVIEQVKANVEQTGRTIPTVSGD